MSVVFRKLKRLIEKEEPKEYKELTPSGLALKIYTSDSLDQRKQSYKEIHDLIKKRIIIDENAKGRIETKHYVIVTNPIEMLDEIEMRMLKVNEAIMVSCAPYLRPAENSHYAELLSYWRKFYSMVWNMLQVTKADIKAMTEKEKVIEEERKKKEKKKRKRRKSGDEEILVSYNPSPLIDVNNLAERMRRFVEVELFTRALYIMKIAYFGKDVAPEYIYASYELPQPMQERESPLDMDIMRMTLDRLIEEKMRQRR